MQDREICAVCGADIPADGNCWYCEQAEELERAWAQREAQRQAEIEAAWAEYERLQEVAENGNLEPRNEGR